MTIQNVNHGDAPLSVTIAIDSFKGSMSSLEAGRAAENGILKLYPDAVTHLFVVADGGEGTVEALTYHAKGCTKEQALVSNPLGEKIWASYFIKTDDDGSKTAIMEMASVAGLPLIPHDMRNPMNTTTYGLGELIKDAVSKGCYNFIIGIGGSATNDGGTGMLKALGFSLTDKAGCDIENGAKGLASLSNISDENALPELKQCRFKIICDVDNPLTGERGCSKVFAPQKGASQEDVVLMEKWMEHYGELAEEYYRNKNYVNRYLKNRYVDDCFEKSEKHNERTDNSIKITKKTQISSTPGAGAAGGLGFAFLMFLNSKLKPGIDLVLEEICIEEAIKNSDIVITGEGCIDAQTLMGKTPYGVAKLAAKHGKKVFAFAGKLGEGHELCEEEGVFLKLVQITPEGMPLTDAMKKDVAMTNMEHSVYSFIQDGNLF